MIVERHLVGEARINDIAACGVDNALRLTRRARGIENEERIFRAHFLWSTGGRGLSRQSVIVVVLRIIPRHIATGAADHQGFHAIGTGFQRLIGIGFQRGIATATRRFVRSDHDFRLRAIHPCRQSVRRESCENNRMDRADAGTGQHRIGGLRDHRDIENDTVAFADAHVLKNIGHATRIVMQLLIGDVLGSFFWAVRLPDDRSLIAAGRQMTVNAVGGYVQRAIRIPVDIHIAEIIADVFDLGKRLDPIDPRALLAPEPVGVFDRGGIHFLIFGCVHVCFGRQFRRRRICR